MREYTWKYLVNLKALYKPKELLLTPSNCLGPQPQQRGTTNLKKIKYLRFLWARKTGLDSTFLGLLPKVICLK